MCESEILTKLVLFQLVFLFNIPHKLFPYLTKHVTFSFQIYPYQEMVADFE